VNSVLNLRAPQNDGKLSSVLSTWDLSSGVQLQKVSLVRYGLDTNILP
jgi:hypothetical protein